MNRREALVLLNMYPLFGIKKYQKILKSFVKLEALFDVSQDKLEKSGLSYSLIKAIQRLKLINPEEEFKKCEKAEIKIVTYEDADYPEALRQIFSPPLVIYFKGEYKVEDHLALAIVGSRRPSIYGRITAEKLSKELARRNITVISGLARGIDTVAHQGSLKNRGRTIAVLGSGLGNIYPPENKRLASEISEKGLLVSEFPYNSPPFSGHFPRRNRLISGFSLGVIVVEAAAKSGALITANFALEQGKEVFAVPGKIDSPTSVGTHQLIQEGAKMVIDVNDILEEFKCRFPGEPFAVDIIEEKKKINISSLEDKIFSLIKEGTDGGVHIDKIIRDSQVDSGKVAGLLFNLELKGLIKQLSGKRFVTSGNE